MTRADDLIGVPEAVRLSGRSARTIRRWIASGRLKDLRPPGHDTTAPVVIRAADLRALLTTESPIQRRTPGEAAADDRDHATGATGRAAEATAAALRERIGDLQDALEDVRRQRDNLFSEVAALRDELSETRRALDAAHRASIELATAQRDTRPTERHGIGGRVRGLLRAVFD